MPQVQAWQCPRTGILFASKASYLKHLESLALKSRDDKARAKFLKERSDRWAEFRNSITDISQLQQAIIDNQDLFWKDVETIHGVQDCAIAKGKGKKLPRLDSFPEFNINFKRDVRASHGAPIGHKTTWDSKTADEHNLASYPGYYGRFKVKFTGSDNTSLGGSTFFGSFSNHHPPSGIHTGSGSGSGNWKEKCTYWQGEIYLFLQDFPKLHEQWLIEEDKRQKAQMWGILNKA